MRGSALNRHRHRSWQSIAITALCFVTVFSRPSDCIAEDNPGAAKLMAVPSANDLREQYKLVRETYGTEIAAAKSAEQKKALAGELRRVAGLSSNPLDRYVLLEGCRKYLAEAGDLDGASDIIDEMARTFAIDRDAVLRDAVAASLDKWDASTSGSAAKFLVNAVDKAISAGNMDTAKQYLAVALTVAKKSKSKDLVAELTRKQTELETRRRLKQKCDEAMESIAKDPDDPEAHLQIGVYCCFIENDWPKGLTHLAKSADDSLAAAARRELRMTTPAEAFPVAEAWLAWAGSQKGKDRDAWRFAGERHARELLSNSLDKLTGLERARAEKVLAAASERSDVRFDARSIPGLAIWLDASESSTLRGIGIQAASPGSPVTSWQDRAKGPLKAVALPKPETCPTLALLPHSKMPAVTFDGVDDALLISDWPINGGTGLTVFLIVGVPAAAPERAGKIETILDNRHDLNGGFDVQIRGDQPGGPLEFATWPLAEGDTRALHDWSRNKPQFTSIAAVSTGREDTLFVNGIRAASVVTKQGVTSREMVLLGAWQAPFMNAPGRHFCGQIAEAIVYRRALSTAEITTVSKVLATKWMPK